LFGWRILPSLPSAISQALGKAIFLHSCLVVGPSLPSASSLALGKAPLCRVPGQALDKEFYLFFLHLTFFAALLQYYELNFQIWYIFYAFNYI
jgi:hypothetical protein